MPSIPILRSYRGQPRYDLNICWDHFADASNMIDIYATIAQLTVEESVFCDATGVKLTPEEIVVLNAEATVTVPKVTTVYAITLFELTAVVAIGEASVPDAKVNWPLVAAAPVVTEPCTAAQATEILPLTTVD